MLNGPLVLQAVEMRKLSALMPPLEQLLVIRSHVESSIATTSPSILQPLLAKSSRTHLIMVVELPRQCIRPISSKSHLNAPNTLGAHADS